MKNVVLFLLVLITSDSFAEKKNDIKDIDAILTRDNVTVGVHAPIDYFLDKEVAGQFGVCAFYLKNKTNLDTSPAVLYARIADASMSGDKGIEILAKEISDIYKEKSKDFKLEKQSDYKSKLGNTFVIRYFKNGPKPNQFEAAGYLKLGSRIVMAIFSAQTEKDFKGEEKVFFDFLDKINPYSTNMAALSGKCIYPKK